MGSVDPLPEGRGAFVPDDRAQVPEPGRHRGIGKDILGAPIADHVRVAIVAQDPVALGKHLGPRIVGQIGEPVPEVGPAPIENVWRIAA